MEFYQLVTLVTSLEGVGSFWFHRDGHPWISFEVRWRRSPISPLDGGGYYCDTSIHCSGDGGWPAVLKEAIALGLLEALEDLQNIEDLGPRLALGFKDRTEDLPANRG